LLLSGPMTQAHPSVNLFRIQYVSFKYSAYFFYHSVLHFISSIALCTYLPVLHHEQAIVVLSHRFSSFNGIYWWSSCRFILEKALIWIISSQAVSKKRRLRWQRSQLQHSTTVVTELWRILLHGFSGRLLLLSIRTMNFKSKLIHIFLFIYLVFVFLL
jgi:hypothetical protein